MADVAPQTEVVVASKPIHSRVAKSQTDSERIANAKARHKATVKAHNLPGAQYGFDMHESYFKDFCGPETSMYAAAHLVYQMRLLDAKFNGLPIPIGSQDVYEPRTGEFKSLGFSLQDLKASVAARIVDLGISEVLLEEYLAEPHGMAASRAFDNVPFGQQMQKCRVA
jgi:hypothetical protein